MESGSSRIYDSKEYLNQYYTSLEGHPEQSGTDKLDIWTDEAFHIIPESDYCLQIGSGPCLLMAAYATRKVKHLILSEYNLECFDFVRDWINDNQGKITFWDEHFKSIAKKDGIAGNQLADRIKKSIVACIKCDLTQQNIIDIPFIRKMDVIMSSLCIEAVANNQHEYQVMVKNLKRYLRKGGHLFLKGVLEETFYKVRQQRLPCLKLNKQVIVTALKLAGFDIIKYNEFYPESPPQQTSDFKGLFAVVAKDISQ